MLDIIYFGFTGQLFSPFVVIVFDFRLSLFEPRLSQHLGIEIEFSCSCLFSAFYLLLLLFV